MYPNQSISLIERIKRVFHKPHLPQSQAGKQKLYEAIVEFDVGLHLVLGGMLLFVIIFMIAWKFDFINYFNQGSTSNTQRQSKTNIDYTPKAAANMESQNDNPIFINQQVVSIDKAFAAKPSNVKLTKGGQLKKEVFGYLPYWAVTKLDEINTSLLTSISYFGLEVGGDGSVIATGDGGEGAAWQTWNDPKMVNFLKKAKRDRIKTYVTVKCFSRDNIEKIIHSPQASENFINNVLYLMSSKNLDGINVDFEYIGKPSPESVNAFSILMSNLNKEMKRQYPSSVLTISTFAMAASTTTLHDVEILAHNSDGLVIMGYDFSTPNSSSAGAVAPMNGVGYSLGSALSSYLEKVEPGKLILAVPYYGYDWPVSGGGKNAPVAGSREDVKILSYAEISDSSKNLKINWDEESSTPWYSYQEPQTNLLRTVHFENTRSLGIKYDYITQKNLQGVGIWALGFDGKNQDLLQLLADKFTH